MLLPRAAGALALAALATSARAESVALGPCALSSLDGPRSVAALVAEDATGDRLVTLNVERCIVTGCSIDPSLMCAGTVGDDADDGTYFNAHTYVSARQDEQFKLDAQAQACADSADCARLGSSQLSLMQGQSQASPIWDCLDDPDNCGGVLWHQNLPAPLGCANGATECWTGLGPDVSLTALQPLPENTTASDAAMFTFPGTVYYKLARNVDVVNGHMTDACTRLPAYQMSRDGMAVVQNECDTLPGCIGFSIETPPNQAPFACFLDSFSRFQPVKLTKYSVKVFLREPRGPLRRFYGYAAYPRGARAAGPALQSFDSDAGYTAGDCASMCDAVTACSGYAVAPDQDRCLTLYQESDRGAVQDGLGDAQFFRKKTSADDALAGCEVAVDACGPGVDGGLVAGLVLLFLALGAAGFVAFRLRQRRQRMMHDDEAIMMGKLGVHTHGSRASSSAGSSVDGRLTA